MKTFVLILIVLQGNGSSFYPYGVTSQEYHRAEKCEAAGKAAVDKIAAINQKSLAKVVFVCTEK